ncbi:MAG TPA: hypothetical protein VJ044_17750, partial [Candidatus Hodarchaeales archaeon]|nr:hypothetical protein [Candidatus Hodarchaeales archaeon]
SLSSFLIAFKPGLAMPSSFVSKINKISPSFIVGKTTLRRWFQIGYHQKNTDEILLSAVTRAPTSCY